MYCGAAFAGSRGEALSLLFFCRRFLFQIKRKCRNAGNIYHLIIVHSEGKKDFCEDLVPLSRKRCVEVAALYKLYINKIVQNLWVDNILPYYTHPFTPNKAKIRRIKKSTRRIFISSHCIFPSRGSSRLPACFLSPRLSLRRVIGRAPRRAFCPAGCRYP